MDILEALNKPSKTLRQEVGETIWRSSSQGDIRLQDMEDSHLLNSAIYAGKRAEYCKANNVNAKYQGRSWEAWETLFLAELDYRNNEASEVKETSTNDLVQLFGKLTTRYFEPDQEAKYRPWD